MRLPVAREFIPVHVYTPEVVGRMASRRGLEPLTPGLGSVGSGCSTATPASKCVQAGSRECTNWGREGSRTGVRALTGVNLRDCNRRVTAGGFAQQMA